MPCINIRVINRIIQTACPSIKSAPHSPNWIVSCSDIWLQLEALIVIGIWAQETPRETWQRNKTSCDSFSTPLQGIMGSPTQELKYLQTPGSPPCTSSPKQQREGFFCNQSPYLHSKQTLLNCNWKKCRKHKFMKCLSLYSYIVGLLYSLTMSFWHGRWEEKVWDWKTPNFSHLLICLSTPWCKY